MALEQLCAAGRASANDGLQRIVERTLGRSTNDLIRRGISWDVTYPDSCNEVVQKAIILKRPNGAGEKGVLLISFENQWLRLFRHANVAALASDYHLVLAPSWSPPHDCAFLLASRLWPGPLFHLLSNFHDVAAFGRLAANSVPVPLLASSWVHPGVFTPDLRATKVYDIVVLANFSKYKRHFSLFKMLRHMPASTSVLLLGKGWQGRDETTLRREASWYGVEDRITVRVGLPDDEMISAMRSAKVGFIPSLNEGSCVAVMELLFCDIPVALFDEAIIGSKVFLNPCTGMLLQRRHAAAQMTTFLARQKEYTPRMD